MKKRTIQLLSVLIAIVVALFFVLKGKNLQQEYQKDSNVQNVIQEGIQDDQTEELIAEPLENMEDTKETDTVTYTEVSAEDDSRENSIESEITDERIEDAIQSGYSTIIVSDVEAKAGDKVQLSAVLVNNPGILGMSVTVSYDEDALELISAQNGEAFADILTMSQSKMLQSGCVFLWDGESVSREQVLDGSILNLEFKVSESVLAGKYPITVICNKDGTVDNELRVVDVAVESGFVKVKE